MSTGDIRKFLKDMGKTAEADSKRFHQARAAEHAAIDQAHADRMAIDQARAAELAAIHEDPESHWVLRLRPLKGFGAPPICNMRRLLKALKRAYGFAAEEHYQIHKKAPPTHGGK